MTERWLHSGGDKERLPMPPVEGHTHKVSLKLPPQQSLHLLHMAIFMPG